jgi:hypothetical protein
MDKDDDLAIPPFLDRTAGKTPEEIAEMAKKSKDATARANALKFKAPTEPPPPAATLSEPSRPPKGVSKMRTSTETTTAKGKLPLPPPKSRKSVLAPREQVSAGRSNVEKKPKKTKFESQLSTAAMPLTGKAALRAIAEKAVTENGVTKIAQGVKGRKSPGYARLQASGKAEALEKETAAAQAKAAELKPTSKAPKLTKAPAKSKAKAADGPSKTDIACKMLLRKGGATRKEIAEATEWPSINLEPIAKRRGLKLTYDKDGTIRAVEKN